MASVSEIGPRQPRGMPRIGTRVYMPDMRQGQVVSSWGPVERPVMIAVDGDPGADCEYRFFPLADLVTVAS